MHFCTMLSNKFEIGSTRRPWGGGAHNGCAALPHRWKCVYFMRTHPEIKLHYSPFIVTSPNHLLDGAQISMYVCSDVHLA